MAQSLWTFWIERWRSRDPVGHVSLGRRRSSPASVGAAHEPATSDQAGECDQGVRDAGSTVRSPLELCVQPSQAAAAGRAAAGCSEPRSVPPTAPQPAPSTSRVVCRFFYPSPRDSARGIPALATRGERRSLVCGAPSGPMIRFASWGLPPCPAAFLSGDGSTRTLVSHAARGQACQMEPSGGVAP